MPSFLVRRRRRWIIERAVDLSTFERNAPPIPPRHGSVNEPIPNYIAQARDPHIPARIRLKNPAQRYEIVRVRPALPVVPEQVGCPVARPSPVPSASAPFPVMPTALRAVLDPSAGAAAVGRAGGRPRARAALRLLRPSHHPSSVRVSQTASERANEQWSGSPCVLT